MKILSVDIGITGAYAVMDGDSGALMHVTDLPTMWNGKKTARVKTKLDGAGWAKELSEIRSKYPDSEFWIAFLEPISSMPARNAEGKTVQGIATTFSLGHSTGVVEGVLAAMKIPFQYVPPPTWKKHFKLLKAEKEASRTLAIQMYPAAPLNLKKHHNRADAVLIARYGRYMERGAD